MDHLIVLFNHDSDLTDADLDTLNQVNPITELTWVVLYNNNLTHLDALSGCTGMSDIHIFNNPDFDTVPDDFLGLKVFCADQCSITDISNLGDLTLVKQLSLSDNLIDDITPLLDIDGFEGEATINLLDNPLDDPDTCTTIVALRNRGVTVQENAAQCRYTLTYQAESMVLFPVPRPRLSFE
jgi:Leucine-rich repeat (LRR) protein